jgi:serine/threonine protein kinase/predicted ATPase/DNA-binding SARP family transcriptional activator
MALQLRLFGSPQCTREGRPILIRRRKAVALLAYLAVTAQTHSRDALATLFWPEYDQSGARANLRRDLSYLKRALDDDVLAIDWSEVGINPQAALHLDVTGFTSRLAQAQAHRHPPSQLCPACLAALTEAVDLSSDDFMAGFSLPDCPEFDEWQFFQRESLRRSLATALQQLIDWHVAQGTPEPGIAYARRWLALDPLHEPAHRRLMQLYAWDGQQAAALRQFDECVRLLDEELGVAPEAETAAMYQAIKARKLPPPATAGASPPPAAAALSDPGLRYVQGELLASGSRGQVYRGLDRVTGATVAIKRLKPELISQGPEYVARFRREGEALSQLNHPNIVNMLAAFEDEGQYCIVMEYVGGGSLRALLNRQATLPPDQVVAIGLELADALSRAHHLGIIHRDLRPENVLLAEDGTPRLADFGVAHLERADVRLTQTGSLLGSPAYMSPEALRGETLDARSDIWSLGVLLYELLAGQRPFPGEQFTAVVLTVLNDEAPAITELRPDIPPPLAGLVGHMLVKERDERLDSMRQVAAELEAIQAGKWGAHATLPDSPLSMTAGSRTVHNLPGRSTPFIGREQEMADVTGLLVGPHARLLTLLGPGGIGKTRLALAAAAAVTEQFVDGVYFVSLAPLKSAEHIPAALAESLDFRFSGAEEPGQQLLNYLRRKQMLLVMDSFEHLLDGASWLIQIVEAAPAVKILVTSREQLNLSGEAVYPLAGMTYPERQTTAAIEPAAYSAVQLLWQRARLVQADFALTGEDLVHAARICQLVGGMPLALVLAAGWLELLSLKEIAAEIAQSLDFLETEKRDVPARQRSIRAVFDSSWQRLASEAQQVFMKLTVFRGGFTRQAAGGVAGAGLRTLRTLANKSLISVDQDGRYTIHELLRQYGEAQLKASGEEEATNAAHSAYYLDLLRRLEDDLKGRRQLAALDEIDSDFENVRAAWEWALQHGDEAAVAGALESLHLFCDMRSRQQEGAALFLLARDRLAPSPGEAPGLTWGRILTRGAFLRLMLAATDSADIVPDLEQGLAIARQHDSRPEIAFALTALGASAILGDGDLAGAQVLLEQSRDYYQGLDDRFYLSHVLHTLALTHASLSGLDAYYALTRQALGLMVEVGSRVDMAIALSNLAEAALGLGDYPASENYITEAITIAGEMGARGILAHNKVMLSLVYFLRGDWEQAGALNAEGLKIASDVNFGVSVAYALALDSLLSGMAGDYTAGQQQAKESLALPANNGLGIILAQWGLSIAECGLGRDEAAWQTLQTTFQQTRSFGSQAILTWFLPVAAILRSRQGEKEGAVELLALGAAHPLSATGWQAQWSLLAEVHAHLERDLGAETFQKAWERGEQLGIDSTIIMRLANGEPPP